MTDPAEFAIHAEIIKASLEKLEEGQQFSAKESARPHRGPPGGVDGGDRGIRNDSNRTF